MTLISAFIVLAAGLVIVPPIVYFGVPLGASRGSVTAQEAVAVALAGVVLVEVAEVLFSWLPVIGWVVAPLTWVVVIEHRCPVTWSTATGVGVLCWAASTLVAGALLLI